MGRRLNGSEIHSLPAELTGAIFDAQPFEVAVDGIAKAIQLEQPDSMR
jgi:hypothetical protein